MTTTGWSPHEGHYSNMLFYLQVLQERSVQDRRHRQKSGWRWRGQYTSRTDDTNRPLSTEWVVLERSIQDRRHKQSIIYIQNGWCWRHHTGWRMQKCQYLEEGSCRKHHYRMDDLILIYTQFKTIRYQDGQYRKHHSLHDGYMWNKVRCMQRIVIYRSHMFLYVLIRIKFSPGPCAHQDQVLTRTMCSSGSSAHQNYVLIRTNYYVPIRVITPSIIRAQLDHISILLIQRICSHWNNQHEI